MMDKIKQIREAKAEIENPHESDRMRALAAVLEEIQASQRAVVMDQRDAAGIDVAVDGIEAVGLVDGELRVNRSPVTDHLARSTPELIVEKLATDADDDFYGRLLEKF